MGARFSKELRPHAVKTVLMSTLPIEEQVHVFAHRIVVDAWLQVETAANSVVMVVLAGRVFYLFDHRMKTAWDQPANTVPRLLTISSRWRRIDCTMVTPRGYADSARTCRRERRLRALGTLKSRHCPMD